MSYARPHAMSWNFVSTGAEQSTGCGLPRWLRMTPYAV
jgi:hypothetical protein